MMDSPKPQVLANKLIHQLVTHTVNEDLLISGRDYMTMRVVFRRCGGSWSKVLSGDLLHLELLKMIVLAWGAMPEQARAMKEII